MRFWRFEPMYRRAWVAVVLLGALPPATPTLAGGPAAPTEAAFLADNAAAMSRMMDGMAIKPSGDIDADFADMMIPHHQGAVDMALAELRYGHNEKLRRIAQGIVVEQPQEITAMRLALGRPLCASAPSEVQPAIPMPMESPR